MTAHASQAFAVEEAIVAVLEGLAFTSFQGKLPRINPDDPDMSGEYIEVVIPERSEIEWARLGCGARDETISVDVVHRLLMPNVKTRSDARARLAEVSAIIESIAFEDVDAQIVGAAEIHDGNVIGVLPRPVPGPQGWIGTNVVSFRFMAAIEAP